MTESLPRILIQCERICREATYASSSDILSLWEKLIAWRDEPYRTRTERMTHIHLMLRASLALHYLSRTSASASRALMDAFAREDIKMPRRGHDPFNRFGHVIYPTGGSSNVQRCAAALRLAEEKGWFPDEFHTKLKEKGGLSGLARQWQQKKSGKEEGAPTPALTAENLKHLEPIGTFGRKGDTGEAGPVLVIATRKKNGKYIAYKTLDKEKDLLNSLAEKYKLTKKV